MPMLADILDTVHKSVVHCPVCGFFMEGDTCLCCSDKERDIHILCVVEDARDILPIEQCGAYRGHYHCLGGKLSPLNDVGPEDLRIEGLLRRLDEMMNLSGRTKEDGVYEKIEVILALGSDVEGEATAHYLSTLLEKYPCRVTRPAQGLPAGSGLVYADSLTLARAVSGRREIHET